MGNNINILYEHIYRFFLGFWLFLLIAFSGDFGSFKMIIMMIIVGISVVEILYKGINFSKNAIVCLLIWLTFVIISYAHGLIRGYEFSFNLFNYFIVTPIFCFILSNNINIKRLIYIDKVILFSFIFILFLSFLYIGFRLDFYNLPPSIMDMKAFGGTKITDTQLEVRLASQASLIFILPYISTKLVFSNKNKGLYSCLLFLGFVVVFFSGRRSLQILFFLGLAINLLYILYTYKISVSFILKSILFLFLSVFVLYLFFEVIASITGLNNPLNTFIKTILLSFDSKVGGGIVRKAQSIHLINFINEAPLFGNGLNSHPIYIRNVEEPWSYEWVYLAFLAQNGLLFSFITFMTLVFAMMVSFKKAIAHSSNQARFIILGIVNGSICFLIAGSSNPMVYFSWFWFLFLIPITKFDYPKIKKNI